MSFVIFREHSDRVVNIYLNDTKTMKFDVLSNKIIGCAIEVHKALGPGLLESAYEQSLAHEMSLSGILFRLQHPLPVHYKGVRLECGYRVDMLVEDKVVIELKSVERINNIHQAQLLTYMKLSKTGIGLLMNFNVLKMKDGIKRMVL